MWVLWMEKMTYKMIYKMHSKPTDGNDVYAFQLAKNPSALLSELIELIINLTKPLPESCNYFSKQFLTTTRAITLN